MSKPAGELVLVQARMPHTMLLELQAIAERDGQPVAAVIRTAVRLYLKEQRAPLRT